MKRRAALLGAALSVFMPLAAQLADEPVALRHGAVEGRLDNGLHYIVMPNALPAGRTEFRLVWRVGSLQQTDAQGGCAHFLEHIAFGGSDNFPDRAAVAYLESMGMKYGIDINAYTGFDRTIYMFATPSDTLRATGYERPLAIVRDWMERLTINPARVDNEKGIILEELRGTVQPDPFYNLKIGQGPFLSRMPLGEPDEIKAMTAQTLDDYYRTWYRPANATLIVVGDLDADATEGVIRRMFADIPAGNPPRREPCRLTYTPARQIMVDVDSLRRSTRVELIVPHRSVVSRTLGDACRIEAARMLAGLMSRRLARRHVGADVSDAWYLGDTDHFVMSVESRGGAAPDSALAVLASEVQAMAAEGFDAREVADAVDAAIGRLRGRDVAVMRSDALCDDFTDYATSGDVYVTDSAQTARLCDMLAGITPALLQRMLRERLAAMDSTLLIAVATTPALAPQCTVESVEAAWRRGAAMPREPYAYEPTVQQEAPAAVMPAVLGRRVAFEPGMVVADTLLPATNVRGVRLRNGITLLMRPTLDADGTVYFASVAPGGTDVLPAGASGMAGYIDMGGIAMGGEGLEDYMYASGMALNIAVDAHTHGFMGAFPAPHATEFFNLVYEKITDPERCYDDYDEIRASEAGAGESVLAGMLRRDPERMLAARTDELMGYAAAAEAAGDYSLDSIVQLYCNLYARTHGTTVILAGDFNPDSMLRAAAPVLCMLPPREAAVGSAECVLPEGILSERFDSDAHTQTAFDYLYCGHYRPCLRNSLLLKLMAHTMRNKAIAGLRERDALVYSPYVGLTYEGLPCGKYYFDLSASAENGNMPAVHAGVARMVGELRSQPVPDSELNALKQSFIITRRETLDDYSPAAWRTTLLSLVRNGESVAEFDRYPEVLASITPADLLEAFRTYIDPANYILLYISNQDFKHEN